MPRAYYNEFDPKAAAWLRELIKAGLIMEGDVDERSIAEVQPSDLVGYARCHFFAGIGGWDYALHLAGWPDDKPVWTGSCPCQPFSRATHGKGGGFGSEKHLWPEWYRLIDKCRPCVIFGEQSADAREWFGIVADQMEASGYRTDAAIVPSFLFGADHARERIYFGCYPNGDSKPVLYINAKTRRMPWPDRESYRMVPEDGIPCRMAYRGFGNAIVPQVAAEFIGAFMDAK